MTYEIQLVANCSLFSVLFFRVTFSAVDFSAYITGNTNAGEDPGHHMERKVFSSLLSAFCTSRESNPAYSVSIGRLKTRLESVFHIGGQATNEKGTGEPKSRI
ncbi:hypothetical protein RJ639_018616 [Escallonia herrerae]|uniref:Uncharacterized protein n=1 Tax=Escallonia herrerae TaxID=1293975 RepID=A0AA89AIM2_9ASTE|nr:hypothetical protein RJ639_018616 [Escallonia herrerae]